MFAQYQQILVARDYQLAITRDRTSNYGVVIRVARDPGLYFIYFYQFCQRRVLVKYLVNGRVNSF